MKILALDASAVAASAALLEDGKLLGEFFLNVGLTHSCTLMPMLEALLKNAGVSVRDIDLFAVTNGPGSFTGVRIGVSAVKGLAEAADKPCIGVSTLFAMAQNLKGTEDVICCVMDARCNQVYTAFFENRDGKVVRLTEDDAISIDALREKIKNFEKNVVFVGDGANLCYNTLNGVLSNVKIAPEQIRYQRASGVGIAVWENGLQAQAVKADGLTVSYLRLSQAERERKQKLEAQQK